MTRRQEALDYFRKAVSLLYREVGVLRCKNHPKLALKAKLDATFFQGNRKQLAKKLYHQSKTTEQTGLILCPYEEETGLVLGDIYQIFAEGNWKNHYGGFFYGGPKWAKIAKTTIELRNCIDAHAWNNVPELVAQFKTLSHNHGFLIDKFPELES